MTSDPTKTPSGPTIAGTVSALSYGGEGLIKTPGESVIFVPLAAPEDEIEVKITESKKNFRRGELQSIITPSPLRVEPSCEVYEKCGGCQYQHLPYEFTLEQKRKHIEESLARVAGIEIKVDDCIPSPKPLHYRNKVTFRCSPDQGTGYVGRNGKLLPIENCPIASTTINANYKNLKPLINELKSKGLAFLTLRTTRMGHRAYVFSFNSKKHLKSNIHRLEQHFGKKKNVSVFYTLIAANAFKPLGRQVVHVAGQETIEEKIASIVYTLSPQSFFQVNTEMAEVMFDQVIQIAGEHRFRRCLDLYCGSGFFGLALASQDITSVGIESSVEAVQNAKLSAQKNNLNHLSSFQSGKVEEILRKQIAGDKSFDSAVVDPPRKGLHPKALRQLAELNINKILYASCEPPTFARDAKELLKMGYSLKKVVPLDMFPQTYHVELLAYFERQPK